MSLSSSNYITLPGLTASATLAAKQYYVVKMASTAKQVIVGAAATDAVIGVVQNDPAAGEEALVAIAGACKAAAEASVSAGDFVASSTTGRVKTTTTGNDDYVGKAIEASSAAGDIITIILAIGNH
jgi:hypothetical protein